MIIQISILASLELWASTELWRHSFQLLCLLDQSESV